MTLREDTLEKAADRHGTPLYLYSEDSMDQNFERFRKAFRGYPDSRFAFSMKGTPLPEIIKIFERKNMLFEITSLGDMQLLSQMGIDLARCIYTSIYKTNESIEFGLRNGIGVFAVDSHSDLRRIEAAAKRTSKEADVLVRVNPGIEMQRTVFASAVPWSKTGAQIECKGSPDCAEALVRRTSESKKLHLLGLHGHIGSQVSDPRYYEEFVSAMLKFHLSMEQKHGLSFEVLDLGGGYPYGYVPNATVPTVDDIARGIITRIKESGTKPRLIIESGRYFVADAGVLLTRVVGTKYNPLVGKIVIVDAGMYNQLLDTMLVSWYFGVRNISNPKGDVETVKIVGCTNDSVDQLDRRFDVFNSPLRGSEAIVAEKLPGSEVEVLKRSLPSVNEGDLLAIDNAGAYTLCFNNNYCMLPVSPVLLRKSNGELAVIRKPQTFTDMTSSFVWGD